MLKVSFDWSSQRETFDKTRSWLALALAMGAAAFSGVLLVLMGDVSLESLRNDGSIEPTLVIFDLVALVVVAIVVIFFCGNIQGGQAPR